MIDALFFGIALTRFSSTNIVNKIKNPMSKKIFTAIAFFPKGIANDPCKYRNISNPENFVKFAKKSGFAYINWYDKETRKFEKREYLQ